MIVQDHFDGLVEHLESSSFGREVGFGYEVPDGKHSIQQHDQLDLEHRDNVEQ